MSRAKNIIKKIFFIVMFIIFSPIILIYYIAKKIAYNSRKKMWKKNGLTGRKLIIATDIDVIDNMEDFEAEDYFKYLFFYQGYTVKSNKKAKKCSQFLINKNNTDSLLKYAIYKKNINKNDLECLNSEKIIKDNNTAIFVTNLDVLSEIHEEYKKLNIEIIDRPRLIGLYNSTIEKLELNNISTNVSDKPINELLDEMYPNSI